MVPRDSRFGLLASGAGGFKLEILPLGDEDEEMEVVLHGNLTISGRVVDSKKRPVPGALVTTTDARMRMYTSGGLLEFYMRMLNQGAVPQQEVVADENGDFVMPVVHRDMEHSLRATRSTSAGTAQSLRFQRFSVKNQPLTGVVLQLR